MLQVGAMIAYSSNCLISPGWLASIAEDNVITNATLLTYYTDGRVFSQFLNYFATLFDPLFIISFMYIFSHSESTIEQLKFQLTLKVLNF